MRSQKSSQKIVFALLIVLFVGLPAHGDEAPLATTAALNLSLSQQVQDAINQGVRLTFYSRFAKSQRWALWHRWQKKHRFSVTHHALSDHYLVKLDNHANANLFRSLDAAMDYIATQSVALLAAHTDTPEAYSIRTNINKYELPGPMRLNAFISPDWDLDTGWVAWQSDQS